MIVGMPLDMIDVPVQQTIPKPLQFSNQEILATHDLISQLLQKNAIEESTIELGDFISNIFLRKKANGSYQLILNLRNFNWYINYCHFKMETLEKILTLVTPLCFMGSLDLSEAYLVVLVALAYRRYLKFIWAGKVYRFRGMPFGLTEAPRKFTKLCRPVLAYIREHSFTIAGYLDDFNQLEQSYDRCLQAITFAYNVIVSLGFLPNHEKSVYIPSQIIESLGHIINSIEMTVSLPDRKTQALLCMCMQAICSPTFPIRHLATIIGKLISCFLVLPHGRLHYRSLERLKVNSLKRSKGSYNAYCTLDQPSIQDLDWWCRHLPGAKSPISRGYATLVMTTDASEDGWSAIFDNTKAHGKFAISEADYSINIKETIAIYFGLWSHRARLQNSHFNVNHVRQHICH